MIIVYFILVLLLLGFISFLRFKFSNDKKLGRKFYDFGEGNFLVYTIFTFITVFIIINASLGDPTFSDPNKQLAYGKRHAQPWLLSTVYRERAAADSLNLDNHFNFINAHFDENQEQRPDPRNFGFEEVYMYGLFTRLAGSADTAKADVGNLCLGLYYYAKGDKAMAEEKFSQVHNQKLKYLNCFYGMTRYYHHAYEEGKARLFSEIHMTGYAAGAYEKLSLIYKYEGRLDLLKNLVYSPASHDYVPYQYREEIYVRARDFAGYLKNLFAELFKNTNLVGFSGALLILLTWVFYLLRINLHRRGSVLVPFGVVLFSAVMIVPVWWLYSFYDYGLGFKLNGGMGHDFLYCVFGIGVIEELVKILPFLIVLRFTKLIREPIDYIMYASLAALGFAFVENFRYFSDDSINIIHSRALTASISHMIDSSIIAYGLILAKFRYKRSSVLYFFLFFLIAAFAHGFYDFWLLNQTASDYWIVTVLCLLVSILVYASFINNALNNPSTPSQNIQLNISLLASQLAAALVGIYVFEFLCLAFIYGPTIADRLLVSLTLSGGYMILFLSIRLSNIDVFPGDWGKIDFFVGLLPMQIIYGDKKPNYNSVLGRTVRLRNFRKKGKLEEILPIEGEIIRREKISGFTGWFLVKLHKPLPYLKLNKEYVLIRSKNPVELIGNGHDAMVHFVAIPDMERLDKPTKRIQDFHFIDWAVAGKPQAQ